MEDDHFMGRRGDEIRGCLGFSARGGGGNHGRISPVNRCSGLCRCAGLARMSEVNLLEEVISRTIDPKKEVGGAATHSRFFPISEFL